MMPIIITHFSVALFISILVVVDETQIYHGSTKKRILKKLGFGLLAAFFWEITLIVLAVALFFEGFPNPFSWYKKFKALPWEIK